MSDFKNKELDLNVDYSTLDSRTSIRVNSNLLKRFQDVAFYNMNSDASTEIRKFMIKFIKENQQKRIL